MSDVDHIQTRMNGTSKSESDCKTAEKAEEETDGAPLTPRQVELIVSTWEPVKPDLQKHGIVLFKRLFEIAPNLLSLFPFDNVSEETPGLKKHASDVMESIDKAVNLLKAGDLEELQDTLLELGIVHHMKSVQVESFAPVGAALLYTLETGLGELFTAEVKAAWVALYSVVQDCMQKGMEEGLDL